MLRLLLLSIIFYSCGTDKTKEEPWKERINELKNPVDSNPSKKQLQKVRDTVVTIYFKNKSLEINQTDIIQLKQISRFCASDSLGYLKIVGFTDTTGTEATNDILSEKRADKVLKYIDPQNKIKSDLVYVTWLGESEDVYDLHFSPTHPRENCVDIWMQIRYR